MAEWRSDKRALAEGQGEASRHRDWIHRRPHTITDPQRYSRFVTIMKRALFLAALALIAAVIAYSLQPREKGRVAMTFEHIGTVANDLAMIKPRLTGTDSAGNPFVVTADRAIQDGVNSHRATLKNVQADITLKGGTWLSASAETGQLNADKKSLQLSGAISIFSDSGYEIHTSSAHVDLANGVMTGNSTITGHGPMGTLRADSFTVDRQTQQITLKGHVKMTFYLHGAKS